MRNTDHRTTTPDKRHATRRHTVVPPRVRERRLPREAAPTITETGLSGKLLAIGRWLRGEPLSRLDSAHTIARLKSI